MQVDQFARYIFHENVDNKRIILNINWKSNCKDLFCLFLDLFCKGMVYIGGDMTTKRAEVEKLTNEHFQEIIFKLRLAGIVCNLELQPLTREVSPDESRQILHWSIINVKKMPANLNVKDYFFAIKVGENICTIRFDVVSV